MCCRQSAFEKQHTAPNRCVTQKLISELFPHLARQADKLCLLHGMHCDQPAHAQAFIQMHTGNFQSVRPSLGAWTLYGLGSESQNLPGFISINPPTATGGAQNYGSAFLPAAFQGTKFTIQDGSQRNRRIDQLRRGEANPYGINNAVNERLTRPQHRDQLDLINALNHTHSRTLGASQSNRLISGSAWPMTLPNGNLRPTQLSAVAHPEDDS